MNLMTAVWLGIAIFGFILLLFVGYIIYSLRVFKFKIELYQNLTGKGYERTKIFRAREVKIPGSLSEKVLWVPKVGEYVSAYGRKMGKNLYWYFEAQDGYWYNMVAGDLDAKVGMLDVEPVNRDVRSFHTTNQKNINERYTKPKNWPLALMSFTIILALVIVFVGGYILYKQVLDGQELTTANIESSNKVVDAAARLLEGIDNVQGGAGSGIKPAPPS